MENEISSGTKLGIVLIALAAIIGLGFGVFSIAKGTANEGVTSVQENLNAVGDSQFSDYDQRIVTGTQVLSAYQNFAGKNYAILIETSALERLTFTSIKDAAGFSTYGTAEANIPKVALSSGDRGFINYNALLVPPGTGTPASTFAFDSNCYRTSAGFQVDTSGAVKFNGVSGNLSKSGMVEYVPTSAKFQAYLIKDASGTIMGIAFSQVKA